MSPDPVEDDPRPVRYATRQPILAADETVIGYKLLFRTGLTHHFFGQELDGASRTTIDMASLVGLNVLCDNRLAFIPSSREALVQGEMEFLPSEKTVAELNPGVDANLEVREACRELKENGFKLALAGFVPGDLREPLVELADFIQVDVKHASWDETRRIAREFGSSGVGLLAEKVDTREDFDLGRKAGYQFFQGYFFRKPETMRARSAPSNRAIYLRLLQAVSRPEMDWDELEELIKKDATIYFRLLRYLNSAAFGIRGEVRSVNQALTLLGENELRRWLRLAGVLEMSQHRPSDLMLSVLVRARFSESLTGKIEHGTTDLFLLGLLSLMDAILEIPMSAVLEGLPLDSPSKQLLLENKGPLLPLYELIWAVETGAWRAVLRTCSRLGIEESEVAAAYSQALEWAQSVSEKA